MIGTRERYLQLRFELLLSRSLAGGTLPVEAEAVFAAELDRCWQDLDDDEQERVEAEIARAPSPLAPEELDAVDVSLAPGAVNRPRRAA